MNLIAIRDKIKNVNNILQVFNAMKLMSSSKYQSYVRKLTNLKEIHKTMKFYSSNLKALQSSGKGDKIYIVVGSDKGLCGSYNSKIKQKLKELPPQSKVVAIGKKLFNYMAEKKFNTIFTLTNIDKLDLYNVAYSLADQLKILPLSSISFVYMKYINGIRQDIVIEDIFQDSQIQEWTGEKEGNIEDVSSYLYLYSKIFRVLMDGKTCEYFFRMQAMENSMKNSQEMKDKLQLVYNKQRQAAITNEILEIANGAIAQ